MDQNKTQARKREQIRDQLQSLPPEVRRYLLSLLDLPRLRGLVRASPIYHQQYLHDRHYLLSSSIETTLSNATVDAYAVYILSKDTIGPGSLALLIDNYTQPSTTLFKKAVEEECIGIAELYFTVRRVAERFSRQLLDDVARSTGQPQHREPSTMEMLRIIRASYRFDILCRLATPDDLNPSYEVRVEDAISFFNIIEPWEVDEVLSFCQFAQYIYGRSVDDIKNELQANNPRLDDHYRPTTPEGALPLDGFGTSTLRFYIQR